jgi:chromosomal replication initiator protein
MGYFTEGDAMSSGLLHEQWNTICSQIKSYPTVDSSQIDAFFSRIEPQAMSDSFLMLTADNDFIKTWVEQNYLDIIKQALFDLSGVVFTVAIAVDPSQEQHKAPAFQPFTQNDIAQNNVVNEPSQPVNTPLFNTQKNMSTSGSFTSETENPYSSLQSNLETFTTSNLQSFPQTTDMTGHKSQPFVPYDTFNQFNQEEYDNYTPQNVSHTNQSSTSENDRRNRPSSMLTFDSFVIGESNRMAYSMAVEVAENPGRKLFNPLFIYGKSGLGKTHLMRAIQNYIEDTRPDMKTIFVDSAEFVSKFMEASVAHDREKSSFKNFKTFYEEADILLIDDVQYLQGKKQTLDIVFQLFNSLTAHGKQIVLSADRAPKNIDIDERYSSRFASGVVVDIQPPDIETKLGIVRAFVSEYSRNEGLESLLLPDDVQTYIAEISSSNIRELKSAVTKVIYQVLLLEDNNITVESVRQLLENHFSGGMSRNLTIGDIQREVENFYKVSHNDLIGPKRSRSIVYPRQMAIFLCRQLLDIPFGDIAKKFNRDHTTAIYSVNSIEELLKTNREVQEDIETLQKIIREL